MSLWTAQQHEWLRALGHPVLLLAGDPSFDAVAPVAAGAGRERPRSEEPGFADTSASGRPTGEHAAREEADRGQRRAAAPANPGASASAPALRNEARQPPERSRPAIPSAEPEGSRASPARERPRADAAAKAAALREARLAARPDVPRDDPLYQAVARTTGLEASAAERVLAKMNIDWARLGADPAAKRALWVRLRRLRRERKP